jgi:hypothetical protein
VRHPKRRALAAALLLALALGAGLWRARVGWDAPGADPRGEAARRGPAGADADAAAAAARASGPARRAGGTRGDAPPTGSAPDPTAGDAGPSRRPAVLAATGAQEGPLAIYLQAKAPPLGVLSAPVRGLDTGAPRRLVLWRLEDGRRVRVADGWSDDDGSLHFPDVLVPDRPLALVVTAAEEGPRGLDRSAPEVVQTGALLPPRARVGRDPSGALRLRLTASRSLGALLVADARGHELARVDLPPVPLSGRRLVEVRLAPDAAGPFQAAQELPDGSRSAWTRLDVPAAP